MVAIKNLLLGFVIIFFTQAAQSSVLFADDRADIGAAYTVDWGNFGPEFTSVASNSSIGNVTIQGANVFTTFAGSTYNSDFSATDTVLALFDTNSGEIDGSFDLFFTEAVYAAGAQVQGYYTGGFTGFISAFNSVNDLLGVFTVSGANNANGDGSAAFAGIVSDSKNISRLQFSGFGAGSAINMLSVNDVPEPSTIFLGLLALALMTFVRRRA